MREGPTATGIPDREMKKKRSIGIGIRVANAGLEGIIRLPVKGIASPACTCTLSQFRANPSSSTHIFFRRGIVVLD
jgi:hypothetical protein